MYKEEGCVKREEYMYKGGRYKKGRGVCIKDGDNTSHLPLSLTVGVHPPWVFADLLSLDISIARVTTTPATDTDKMT